MMLTDPAKTILLNLKPEVVAKDKEDNLKVKDDAKKERLKVWVAPTLKKDRDDARAVRIEDWMLQSGMKS
jgi:hypothetical protein